MSHLERISRSGKFGIEDSNASPVWKNCPNMEAHFLAVLAGNSDHLFVSALMITNAPQSMMPPVIDFPAQRGSMSIFGNAYHNTQHKH
ncbi:hypothetical protein [Dictyobacter arantiisoli]|uniref:hypothetical protein n=1 Tax=Dictyobacter arantiisoli TaxID=2014874 RepID=UPI0011EF5C2E|nr:hypothetical protein [Dictyobacter arantiisoli]